MEATVEISMYPLREDYEPAILEFIEVIKRQEQLSVRVNETSTHLFGDFDLIFETLKNGIKTSFEKYGKVVFVMKVLNGNLKA
jgi:uncharacterized protein YqgV (UPF0045/DUF77 family)